MSDSATTHEFLFRLSGGLTLIKVHTETLHLDQFKAAMMEVGVMTASRYEELYKECIGDGSSMPSKPALLVQLVSSEVMAISHTDYVKVVEAMADRSIQVEEFGKKKNLNDGQKLFGVHRIRDEFVALGYEYLIEQFNLGLKNAGQPIFVPFEGPFPPLQDPDDLAQFFGSVFTVSPYVMTDSTPTPEMAAFGFPSWPTSTDNRVIFCSREGDLFVLTNGRGAQFVEPFWDQAFPGKVAQWVRGQPMAQIQNTVLFNNRYKREHVLIALSIMARALPPL